MFFIIICCLLLALFPNEGSRQLVGFDVMSQNYLLRLGAIVIQMKFDVIMDLLKRRKLKKFSPENENLQWKCETQLF